MVWMITTRDLGWKGTVLPKGTKFQVEPERVAKLISNQQAELAPVEEKKEAKK